MRPDAWGDFPIATGYPGTRYSGQTTPKELTMIFAIIAIVYVSAVAMFLAMCRVSALSDKAARKMLAPIAGYRGPTVQTMRKAA
jgi:hypothetical protein